MEIKKLKKKIWKQIKKEFTWIDRNAVWRAIELTAEEMKKEGYKQ